MGCDLPKIHIEWDDAHAAGLTLELRTYRQIVSRLGSHEGVETSLDTQDADGRLWGREPSDVLENTRESGECAGSVLHDVRAMCRSLGRLRDLGATVTIDGREATVATLDAYEDTLAREVCRLGGDASAESGDRAVNGERGGSLLSTIVYVVGLAVVLQWVFSCS